MKRRLKLAWHVLTQEPPDASKDSSAEDTVPQGCPIESVEALQACPLCGHGDRTLVCEFNKFVLMVRPPDDAASRYDYVLCHGCGVVYASLRPVGERYSWLLHHFEETIGRTDTGRRSIRKLTLSSFSLSDDERLELRKALQKGVFVSEHLGVSRKDYVPSLLPDRLAVAPHVELLGSLLNLKASRVLEIRSRTGALSAALTRLYGAQATATALFEHQQLVIRELYGIRSFPMDYENFVVPERGPYDLIVANHFITHSVRPKRFFAAIHDALVPGGHLYLYNEPDDVEFLAEGRSMFNTLNAFHLQAFDGPSLVRALAANGFQTVLLAHNGGSFVCLARSVSEPAAVRLPAKDLQDRQQRYRHARDIALMSVPVHVRPRLESLWRDAADRMLAAGEAEIDHTGRVRLRKVSRRADG